MNQYNYFIFFTLSSPDIEANTSTLSEHLTLTHRYNLNQLWQKFFVGKDSKQYKYTEASKTSPSCSYTQKWTHAK